MCIYTPRKLHRTLIDGLAINLRVNYECWKLRQCLCRSYITGLFHYFHNSAVSFFFSSFFHLILFFFSIILRDLNDRT